ncbi:MAG: FAD-binding oxidoreductase [Candidatus Omnitrophica bacterium]|nr:FAD-binding oxidoreductase [Candidatus Omnitrophota bacterium]
MLSKKDLDLTQSYLEDYSNIRGGFCDAVHLPQNDIEASQLLKESSQKKIPITISGAGTGVAGGRVPFGGDILSLEKMNRILEIKKFPSGEGEALLEGGVLLQDFLDAAEAKELFYPPNPTEKSSCIGGNISTSASGARSFRFGTTRDYVLGLKVLLSSGEVVDIERGKIFSDKDGYMDLPLGSGDSLRIKVPGYKMPKVKNAAGYYSKARMDAIDLFIGQEGTLGIVTRARLKLLKPLKGLLDCYAFFSRQQDALNFIYKAKNRSRKSSGRGDGLDAISLEFFDGNSLRLLRQRNKNIPGEAEGAVYFGQEVDKDSESTIIDAWADLIQECGGSLDDTWFAQTKKEQDELARVRHDLPDMVNEYIKQKKITKVGTDLAVPDEKIDDMIGCYTKLLGEAGLPYVMFGHIGDSHLHVNILPTDEAGCKRAKDIYKLFVERALSLGGTVSAEHGIGKTKHAYLEMMYGKNGLKEMAGLKKRIDPPCILGLDNIFSKELLR